MPLLHYTGIQATMVGTQDVNSDQELLIAPYLIIFWGEGSHDLCPELSSNFKTKYYVLSSNVDMDLQNLIEAGRD
jgi:hypothetical protein